MQTTVIQPPTTGTVEHLIVDVEETHSRYWIVVGLGPNLVPFAVLPEHHVGSAMGFGGYVSPHYVYEKLGLPMPDCKAIAKILSGWDAFRVEAMAEAAAS